MRFYLDVSLLPNIEANIGFIWQKVYGQIHLALVEQKTASGNSKVAVSFPEYGRKSFPLGSKLRLIAATSEQLENLNIAKWLARLTDYTHCTSIKEVPANVQRYAVFKRVQFKTNIERMARRRAKRKDESFEDALSHYSGLAVKQSKLPFINMQSSNGKRFPLFIEMEIIERTESGEFSCYGLSGEASIPCF